MDEKFDRKTFEDTKALREYKDNFFDGKKTAVEFETGKTLHYSKTATLNKYGGNMYKYHAVEIDHIVPLKFAHTAVTTIGADKYLSNEDFKSALNSDFNYHAISERRNRSKGSLDPFTVAYKEANAGNYITAAKTAGTGLKATAAVAAKLSYAAAGNYANAKLNDFKSNIGAIAGNSALNGVINSKLNANFAGGFGDKISSSYAGGKNFASFGAGDGDYLTERATFMCTFLGGAVFTASEKSNSTATYMGSKILTTSAKLKLTAPPMIICPPRSTPTTPVPCKLVQGAWQNADDKTFISDTPCLTQKSKTTCSFGGGQLLPLQSGVFGEVLRG